MNRRYFIFKAIIVLFYLGVVGATVSWVLDGWPKQFDNDLNAEISAVPGALEGRMLVLVANQGDFDWTNVTVVLNGGYVFTLPKLAPGERHSISMEDFSYTYAVPRPWTMGVWRGLADGPQPGSAGPPDLAPQKIEVKTAEGVASATLASSK